MNSPSYDADLDIAIQALKNLAPGDAYVYFVGFLEEERMLNKHSTGSRLSDIAYSLMLEGKVYLTQKRVSLPAIKGGAIDWNRGVGNGFKYIATGAHPKKDQKPNKSRITFAQIAGEWRR